MWDNNIAIWAEEIGMDGAVGMSGASKSTLYRWAKAMNEYLIYNKYEWRVKANYKKCLIEKVA